MITISVKSDGQVTIMVGCLPIAMGTWSYVLNQTIVQDLMADNVKIKIEVK